MYDKTSKVTCPTWMIGQRLVPPHVVFNESIEDILHLSWATTILRNRQQHISISYTYVVISRIFFQ